MTVRFVSPLVVAIALLLCIPPAIAAEKPVYDACRDLVMDYAWYRDHPDPDAYAALFTEDAELSILGDIRKGRTAIRERLTQVTGGTVHLMSTVRITPVSDTEATGVSYVTVYTTPAGDGPHTVDAWAGVGEYHDTFRKTAAGWQIARRTLVMRLRDAGFRPSAD